jgi:hypothetical protein
MEMGKQFLGAIPHNIVVGIYALSLSCGGGSQRDEELKKKGWVRQFVTDEPRLSEAVELYKEIGYEVHLEEAAFEEANQLCKNCLQSDCAKYKTIYIRKKK